MAIASGTRANRAGRRLETFVSETLDECGYELVRPSEMFFAMQSLTQPIYAAQCEIGEDIYGKTRRCDFILYHPRKWPDCLVIQCKWQSSSGSVDEKFPFEVLSIRKNPYPTIILLDGGGYSKGAETWLRAQARKDKAQARKDKLEQVFSMGDFQRYVSRGENPKVCPA